MRREIPPGRSFTCIALTLVPILATLGWSRLDAVTDSPLRDPAGQGSRLPDPRRQLRLVELVVLVDVEVAHFLVLGLARRDGTQRRAAEESHLDVIREGMKVEKP